MSQDQITPDTLSIVPAQISATLILHPWVSLAQYQALLNVIDGGLQQYSFMIDTVTLSNIPPSTITFPAHIVMQGVDPTVTQQQILDKINQALATLPGFVSADVEQPQ